MTERVKSFGYGVIIKETCWAGLRAALGLIRPPQMSDADFEEYLSACRAACQECAFKKGQICQGVKTGAPVAMEVFRGGRIMDELMRHKAPCVKGGGEVTLVPWKSGF